MMFLALVAAESGRDMRGGGEGGEERRVVVVERDGVERRGGGITNTAAKKIPRFEPQSFFREQ